MKCNIKALSLVTVTVALMTLSGAASADWWDGWNNGNGSGQGYGTGQGNTQGAGNGSGDVRGSGQGWGTGKGNADGEVDFTITFKGKGKTDMDTAGNMRGDGQGAGNSSGNWVGQGNSASNFSGNGYGQGDNSGYGSDMPWGNNNNWGGSNRRYMFAPRSSMPAYTQRPQTRTMAPSYATSATGFVAPTFEQQQAQMEAMRKKFEAMATQIAEQQKAVAAAHLKAQASPTATPVENK